MTQKIVEALRLAVASYEDPSIWLDQAREALCSQVAPTSEALDELVQPIRKDVTVGLTGVSAKGSSLA